MNNIKRKLTAKEKWIAVVAGFVIAFLVFGSVYTFRKPSEPNILRIGYTPYLINLPAMVADASGYFEGYKTELINFKSTDAMLAALQANQIDLASSLGLEKVFEVNSHEGAGVLIRPVLFNAFSIDTRSEAIVVSIQNVSIKSITDLNGRSIGTLPATTAVTYCELIAKKNNISFSSIKRLAPDVLLPALAKGEVDALLLIEPFIAHGVTQEIARPLIYSPVAKYVRDPTLIGAHALNETKLKVDENLGKVVAKALGKARDDIKKDPLAAMNKAAKYLPFDTNTLKVMNPPAWRISTEVTDRELQDHLQFFKDAGILTDNKFYRYDVRYLP